MTLMSAEVYDALVSAGAPDDKARRAAEAIAATTRDQIDIRGEFSLVKWMLGSLIVLVLGLYGTLFAFAINHAPLR